jgi:hypothetical protein
LELQKNRKSLYFQRKHFGTYWCSLPILGAPCRSLPLFGAFWYSLLLLQRADDKGFIRFSEEGVFQGSSYQCNISTFLFKFFSHFQNTQDA